jgi:ribosomal RNA-processing protein 36
VKAGEDGELEQEKEEEDERRPTWLDTKAEANQSSTKPKVKRSSKHAPTEVSSKRMVTRKREVVSMNVVAPRDPRFSAATTGDVDERRARKAYAFLDEYRDSEMTQLRAAMKKTKSVEEKEEIARTLKSMQGRKEAQAKRDAEQELIAQHRRQEKELVAQGKTPFYLKKSEQKKQLLLDRFAGMKKKEIDRSIERRRKKLTSRERKNMPIGRRGAAE